MCVSRFKSSRRSLFSVWKPVLVIRLDLRSLIHITWFTGNRQRLCVLVSLWLIAFHLKLKIIVKIGAFLSVRRPFSARRLLRQHCVSAKWPSDLQSYFCVHFLLVGFLFSCPLALSENLPGWRNTVFLIIKNALWGILLDIAWGKWSADYTFNSRIIGTLHYQHSMSLQ